jgi:hypothetical protein
MMPEPHIVEVYCACDDIEHCVLELYISDVRILAAAAAPPPPEGVGMSSGIKAGGFPAKRLVPTLPNPSMPMGGGLPLWVGILMVGAVATPLVFLILSGARW